MIFLLVAVLLDITSSEIQGAEKLIRLNQWEELDVTEEGSILDVHLFATCEKFSIVFQTEENEYTRFRFRFDDTFLKKIDIDSLTKVDDSKTPRLIGSCRAVSRKLLKIHIAATNNSSFINFQIADQIIRRPFDFRSTLKVIIPQNVSCCLIRALYLSNSDHLRLDDNIIVEERVSPRLNIVVGNRTTTTNVAEAAVTYFPETVTHLTIVSTTDENPSGITKEQWSLYTIGQNPIATSTHLPKSASSWTHAVNKEWSVTFVICSIVVCFLMLFLILFGIFMFFYLMTKPSGGKSPYRIDA